MGHHDNPNNPNHYRGVKLAPFFQPSVPEPAPHTLDRNELNLMLSALRNHMDACN